MYTGSSVHVKSEAESIDDDDSTHVDNTDVGMFALFVTHSFVWVLRFC